MERNVKVFMEDCAVVGDKIYFFSRDWNALCVTSLKTNETKFVSVMPGEKINAKRLCAGIIHYKNKLILIPMTAEKIWIYNLKNDQWKGLAREYMDGDSHHNEIFKAISYKGDLIFIGSNYPSIIRMNLETNELKYFNEPYTFLAPLKTEDQCYFRTDYFLNENQLLLASCLNNYVLRINLDSFDFEWCEVGERDFCYSGIAWDGKHYWLSPRRGTPIVKWDGKGGTEYINLPDGFDGTINNFLGVQYDNGKLIFPGMLQNKTIIIDPNNSDNMEICEGRYLFYKCFGDGGVVLQNYNGLFRLKKAAQNEQYDLYCEVRQDELIGWIKEYSTVRQYGQVEIDVEYTPSALPVFLSVFWGNRESIRKRTGIGENIWENIQN